MNKAKIFELKIEEDDEISGIDSISLVDEPAIEINWVAFNKIKPQEFVIPDGDDLKYSEMVTQKGQSEEELLKDGWEVVKQEFLSSSPNAESIEDTNEYLIRYKYIKNPEAPGADIKETTRDFCVNVLLKNFVYRVEDLDAITNDEGDSAMVWRGGYNCRHIWQQITYRRDAKIVNKGSVTKGRVDDLESLDVLGLPQPDTRTSNPSFSKEKFEDVNVDVYGYKTKYFQICPGAQATFQHLISMDNDDDTIGMIRSAAVVADSIFKIEYDVLTSKIATEEQLKEAIVLVDDFKDIINEVDKISGMKHNVSYMDGHIETIKSYVKQNMQSYSDYPDSVKNNAKAVLKYVEENGWGDCGTDVGKQRANQLAKGEPISQDTIQRMYSYLSRHAVDLDSSKGYGDGCGKLMYDSWGGKSALSWAESKVKQFGYDNNLPSYVDEVATGKTKNFMDQFEYLFTQQTNSKQHFQTDAEKRIVLGPAMIPDMKIFRKDKKGDPYYVFFSAETIKMIAEKYMKNKYLDNNDMMHDGTAVPDVYVTESWIKEDDNDKSVKYGYGDLPIGTWFVAMKVKNDEIWSKVKDHKLNGFSVSGFFEEVAAFHREEAFLKELAEILKKIK